MASGRWGPKSRCFATMTVNRGALAQAPQGQAPDATLLNNPACQRRGSRKTLFFK